MDKNAEQIETNGRSTLAIARLENQHGPVKTAELQTQAWAVFSNDLQGLLRTDLGKWVAYRGREKICTGVSQSAVYHECLRRGFAPEELFVELIYPAAAEEPTVLLSPGLGA